MEARIGVAREAARKLLRKYGIKTAPIPVLSIISGEGYRVEEVNLDDRVSGFCRAKDKCIYINSRHHDHRKRFTLGHELGHLALLHEKLKAMDFSDLEQRSSTSNEIDHEFVETAMKDMYEIEADEFAGELLVPRALLKNDWQELGSIDGVVKHYNVSPEVASIAYMRIMGAR
ncbi:MAG: ImmA/IrrE family metallo-endopeptidase [Armatimonadetes bacterium]|nr:ImmA/IrrE family metallo-endopeptidase [Armatimonadota bacterium]